VTTDTPTDTNRATDSPTVVPDGYTVPADAEPVTCEYCGAPFSDEEGLALHRGVEHGARLTDAEREAFRAAYEEESEELRLFRLKAVAALVAIYFVLLMAFSVFG
jgi:hypothetical protein